MVRNLQGFFFDPGGWANFLNHHWKNLTLEPYYFFVADLFRSWIKFLKAFYIPVLQGLHAIQAVKEKLALIERHREIKSNSLESNLQNSELFFEIKGLFIIISKKNGWNLDTPSRLISNNKQEVKKAMIF